MVIFVHIDIDPVSLWLVNGKAPYLALLASGVLIVLIYIRSGDSKIVLALCIATLLTAVFLIEKKPWQANGRTTGPYSQRTVGRAAERTRPGVKQSSKSKFGFGSSTTKLAKSAANMRRKATTGYDGNDMFGMVADGRRANPATHERSIGQQAPPYSAEFPGDFESDQTQVLNRNRQNTPAERNEFIDQSDQTAVLRSRQGPASAESHALRHGPIPPIQQDQFNGARSDVQPGPSPFGSDETQVLHSSKRRVSPTDVSEAVQIDHNDAFSGRDPFPTGDAERTPPRRSAPLGTSTRRGRQTEAPPLGLRGPAELVARSQEDIRFDGRGLAGTATGKSKRRLVLWADINEISADWTPEGYLVLRADYFDRRSSRNSTQQFDFGPAQNALTTIRQARAELRDSRIPESPIFELSPREKADRFAFDFGLDPSSVELDSTNANVYEEYLEIMLAMDLLIKVPTNATRDQIILTFAALLSNSNLMRLRSDERRKLSEYDPSASLIDMYFDLDMIASQRQVRVAFVREPRRPELIVGLLSAEGAELWDGQRVGVDSTQVLLDVPLMEHELS